ncbi:MAG TPA: LysR substrate-binding domain-containing protein [Terriglobia bacterium]|nr:LysR substrate-binding domain-containing protein [Terriglobia bacterium]
MELRHLRYFIAVAEELNFTRAAERLETAQPSLSQQIKQLEAYVGAVLLVRNKRQVALTEAGRTFLAEAREILERAEHAVRLTRRAAEEHAGELSVAVGAAAEVKVLPKLLPLVRRRMPDLKLVLYNLPTIEQKAAFRKHALDVGFLRGPVSLPDVHVEELMEEKLLVGLPSRHPLAAKKKVRVEDLNRQPFIMISRKTAPELHDAVEAFCRNSGLQPPVAQLAGNVLGNLNLIRTGVGFSLLPDYVASILPRGVILRRLDVTPEPVVPLMLVWSRRLHSPLLPAFLRLVRECFL